MIVMTSNTGRPPGGPEASPETSDDREDVALAHDQVVLAVDLNLGPGVLAVQDRIADLDLHLDHGARIRSLARTGGDDLALLRLLLGIVGDVQPARGLLRSLQRL